MRGQDRGVWESNTRDSKEMRQEAMQVFVGEKNPGKRPWRGNWNRPVGSRPSRDLVYLAGQVIGAKVREAF